MIDEIVNGIAAAIHEAYPAIPIYTEKIEQNFAEPSFSILCVNPSQKQMLGKRYLRKHLFNINYFPSNVEEIRAECYGVLETLLSILEIITVGGDKIRGTSMNGHIEDGVLVFCVNYDFFIHVTPTDNVDMDEIEVTEGVNQS